MIKKTLKTLRKYKQIFEEVRLVKNQKIIRNENYYPKTNLVLNRAIMQYQELKIVFWINNKKYRKSNNTLICKKISQKQISQMRPINN